MSVLDMFASALGAFIMCAIILLPYREDVTKKLDATKENVAQRSATLERLLVKAKGKEEEVRTKEKELDKIHETKRTLAVCHDGLNKCQVELAKTFLLVKISFKTSNVGVILLVTDPKGNRFSRSKTNRAGRDFAESKASMSFAVTEGDGTQVWLDPEAGAGTYKIEYELTREPQSDVVVKGYYFDRYGRKDLPTQTLRKNQLHVLAATLELDAAGTITMR